MANERTATPPAGAHIGPVTLINWFEVPTGRDGEFFNMWQAMSAFFRAQPGYVSNRLHYLHGHPTRKG